MGGGGGGLDRLLSTSKNKNTCKCKTNNQSIFESGTVASGQIEGLTKNHKKYIKFNNYTKNKVSYNGDCCNSFLCYKNKKSAINKFNNKKDINYNEKKFANYQNINNILDKENCNTKAIINKRHNKVQSMIMLLSWLFVILFSFMLICFGFSFENNKISSQSNFIADGISPNQNAEGKYEINSPEHLLYLSTNTGLWNQSFIQTCDIEMNVENWTPIGNESIKFTGNYDGGNFTITFNSPTGDSVNILSDVYAGLFGYADGCTIKNLGIKWKGTTQIDGVTYEGLTINNKNIKYIGGIVGRAVNSSIKIENCYNLSNINVVCKTTNVNEIRIGGIAGFADCEFTYCFNLGNINVNILNSNITNLNIDIGGIVGYTYYIINNCFNKGEINVESSSVASGGIGGIVGRTCDCISNAYNTSNIKFSGKYDRLYVAGIAGERDAINTIVSNCYNLGEIISPSICAGIMAGTYETAINNCFSIVDSTNISDNYYGVYYDGGAYDCYSLFYNYGKSAPNTVQIEILDEYLQLKDNNLDEIIKNYTQGFSYNGSSYSFSWDFDVDWGIETNVNSGFPYLQEFLIDVVFDSSTQGDSPVTKHYVAGDVLTITDDMFVKDNDILKGVKIDGVNYEIGDTIIVTKDISIMPNWSSVDVKFNINTNVGAVLIISDDNGYVQQIFVDKVDNYNDSEPTFTLTLTPDTVYKVVISVFYTTNVNFGDSYGNAALTAPSGQVLNGNVLTFTASEDLIIRLNLNGFVGNNGIVI